MLARIKVVIVTAMAAIVSVACTTEFERRGDDEAMLLYRECMNASPQQSNPIPTQDALSSNSTRQSVSSVTRSQREAESEMECARLAGWEEK